MDLGIFFSVEVILNPECDKSQWKMRAWFKTKVSKPKMVLKPCETERKSEVNAGKRRFKEKLETNPVMYMKHLDVRIEGLIILLS